MLYMKEHAIEIDKINNDIINAENEFIHERAKLENLISEGYYRENSRDAGLVLYEAFSLFKEKQDKAIKEIAAAQDKFFKSYMKDVNKYVKTSKLVPKLSKLSKDLKAKKITTNTDTVTIVDIQKLGKFYTSNIIDMHSKLVAYQQHSNLDTKKEIKEDIALEELDRSTIEITVPVEKALETVREQLISMPVVVAAYHKSTAISAKKYSKVLNSLKNPDDVSKFTGYCRDIISVYKTAAVSSFNETKKNITTVLKTIKSVTPTE